MKRSGVKLRSLLIIPAYNEEESLEATMSDLYDKMPSVDALIVNDGSSDRTAQICRDRGYPFLDLPVNLGLAGALQAGMKYAFRHGYDCAIQYDADGQHLPEYVPQLIQGCEANDIVIGSRFENNKKPLSLRVLGGNLIKFAIKLTTGQTINDPTSGMRAFNARMIEKMAQNMNMGPEPDTISYLIKRAGAKVIEIPVQMKDRTAGESYLNPWTSTVYMIRMAISILFIQFFRKKIED